MSIRKVEMASNAALQAVDSRASFLHINLSNKRNTKPVIKILTIARTKKRTRRKMIPRRLNDPCYIEISTVCGFLHKALKHFTRSRTDRRTLTTS
jgi:hypothetical protein